MSDPFLGEIKAFAGGFAPAGWLPCDGRTLPITNNQALFALLGTYYGGDGKTNFALPNLNGAFALGAGRNKTTQENYPIGETTSRPTVTLTADQMPLHGHNATFAATSDKVTFSIGAADKYGALASPNNNILAQSGVSALLPASTYATSATAGAQLNGVTSSGGTYQGGTVALDPVGGAPVSIMPPFVAVTYMIATQGIFPPRP